MKKRFFCLSTILLLFPFYIFARSYGDGFSVEVFTSVDNISDSEKNWIGAAVEERLEANFSKYTNFKIVNNANKQQILQIQKSSENAVFDENAMLEAGKYTTAEKGVFVNVRMAGSVYTISVRITDLTTGENIATVVGPGKKNIEDLYAFNGCSVDFITIELCDQLGISLSASERHIIMHGESGLSIEEKNKLYEDDFEMYSNRIKDLDKEINSLNQSSYDLDFAFKQSQLEAEKSLAEEKLKLVKENKRRAAEEERNRQIDAQRDAARSAAQREKIDNIARELNLKLKAVSDTKLERESVLGQIKIIELKKKYLVEIQQKIDFEKQEILKAADKLIAQETDIIRNRVPRTVETDGRGNLSESAKANRERDIREVSDKILKQAQNDIKRLKQKIETQNHELLEDIYDDYKHLSNKTVNTLGDELIVDYGNYDGNRDGWPLFITVKSDDVIIFQTTSFISYKKLTDKNPIKNHNDPKFNDFANEVDFYQSLFHRGEPIITYEIDYSTKPLGLNYPSQYKFYFNSLKYFDTRSMSIRNNTLYSDNCGILFLDNKEITRKMLPSFDLRNIEGISHLDYNSTVADISSYHEENNFVDYSDTNPRIEENNNEQVAIRNTNMERNLFIMNCSFTGIQLPGTAVQLEFDSAINNYMFISFNLDVLLPSEEDHPIYPVTSASPSVINSCFNFGGNYKLNSSIFPLNFWGSVGVGFNYFVLEESIVENEIIDFVISCDTGVDVPVIENISIIVGYGIDIALNRGIYDKLSFGVGINYDLFDLK